MLLYSKSGVEYARKGDAHVVSQCEGNLPLVRTTDYRSTYKQDLYAHSCRLVIMGRMIGAVKIFEVSILAWSFLSLAAVSISWILQMFLLKSRMKKLSFIRFYSELMIYSFIRFYRDACVFAFNF